MHAIGEAGGNDEAGAVGALGAEGMRLVDDEGGAVALADFHEIGQGRDVAIGAVEGIDADEPGAALRQGALERLHVVMAEENRLCAGADDAFVQRYVRLHVKIDRGTAGGKRLDEADVGRIAGGAEDAVLGAHQGSDALLEAADDVALMMHPDARDGVAVAAGAQRRDLALDDMRVPGEAEVVVTADFDVARPRRAALQGMASLPEIDFAADMVVVDARLEKGGLIRTFDFDRGPIYALICNSKQHCPPLTVNEFLTNKYREFSSIQFGWSAAELTQISGFVPLVFASSSGFGPNWTDD